MLLKRGNVERRTENSVEAKRLVSEGFVLLDGKLSKDEEPKSIDSMTSKELKALAKAKGIEGAEGFTKAELLAVLKEEDDELDGEAKGTGAK